MSVYYLSQWYMVYSSRVGLLFFTLSHFTVLWKVMISKVWLLKQIKIIKQSLARTRKDNNVNNNKISSGSRFLIALARWTIFNISVSLVWALWNASPKPAHLAVSCLRTWLGLVIIAPACIKPQRIVSHSDVLQTGVL